MTRIQPLDPPALPPISGNYTHGTLVTGAGRLVFVSGQVPWSEGSPPADFETQCRMVWDNIRAVLAEAGLGLTDVAKVTTYLADREYRAVNGRVRTEILGDHRPALTIIIADIYDEEWLLEIEVIAVGPDPA